MATLYYTVGLPASGKTTYARNMVQDSEGTIREIAKDDLRLRADAPKGRGKQEKWVIAEQDRIIADALANGISIVVHDTNLNPFHARRFAKIAADHEANLEKVDFTHVDVWECVARDAKRDNPVGETVIWGMWQKYLYTPAASSAGNSDKRAIMVDIDGTLARMGDRSPYDWSRVHLDTPVQHVVELVQELAKSGNTILFLSGRDSSCSEATRRWLDEHVGVQGPLLMRPEGDTRPDSVVKAELYDRHIAHAYDVRFALDDRNKVVHMWRTKGIPVLQVEYGYF